MTQPTKQQIKSAILTLLGVHYFTVVCLDNLNHVKFGSSTAGDNVYNKFNDMTNSYSDSTALIPFQSSTSWSVYGSYMVALNQALQFFDKSSSGQNLLIWANEMSVTVDNFRAFLQTWMSALTKECETAPDA